MNLRVLPDANQDDPRLLELATLCEQTVAACRVLGADQAEVVAHAASGLEVGVRRDQVETLIRSQHVSATVTAWRAGRKGVVSVGDMRAASLRQAAERACAFARLTEPDVHGGLADPDPSPRQRPPLDLWHPWALEAEQAIELARQTEAAGRDFDARIANTNGAQLGTRAERSARADSNGFLGTARRTRHQLWASFITRDARGMQTGSWYDSRCSHQDLQDPDEIGRRAALHAVQRLGARRLGTRQCPVLFAPDVAAGLFGHFLEAVSGAALCQRASFLADGLGQPVFPAFMDLHERPHLPRGAGSRHFDAEGVAAADDALVLGGRLQRYALDGRSARELGMASTGNAGGISNLQVRHGPEDLDGLLRRMHTGLLVTQVMGQGVSIVTGDYSRGVSGFWVEHGAVAYPVDEITIASNLREMFAGIVAVGRDVDTRGRIRTGSLLIERMTVAGAG